MALGWQAPLLGLVASVCVLLLACGLLELFAGLGLAVGPREMRRGTPTAWTLVGASSAAAPSAGGICGRHLDRMGC